MTDPTAETPANPPNSRPDLDPERQKDIEARQRRIDELQRKLAQTDAFERNQRSEKRWKTYKSVGAIILLVASMAMLVVAGQSGIFSGVGAERGKRGPDFAATDSEGKQFQLSNTDGTARVLFFMTTGEWCQPCKLMTRGPLREIQQRYGANVTIVSIEMIPDDQPDDDLNAYKARYNATWTFLRDTNGIADTYDVRFLSVVVILDQDGYIKFTGSDPPTGRMSEVIEAMGIRPQGV